MAKYFNIVRVFPKVDGNYDWTKFSSEFLEMSGYPRWYSLRDSNSIRETLDVYVMKDIDSSEVENLRYNLKDKFSIRLDQLSDEAYKTYNDIVDKIQFKTDVDKAEDALTKSVNDALKTVNAEFTKYLEDNFTKLEFK